MAEDNRNKPLYMISVAAELTGMHPQTLRVYESKGLVNPQRSGGNTRLYSRADIERLELINQLTDEGINLAGVVRILDMKERAEERERENEKLRARVRQLEDELHEYKMQKKITALAPRDGSVNPEQVMRKLLGAGGDLRLRRSAERRNGSTLRAAQSDNLSFKRQGMTRRSMPCLFHANLFALDVARCPSSTCGVALLRMR